MKKIFIIGIVASGKTTLAKQLSTQINVPWYELDSIVHYQSALGRIKQKPEEQVEKILEIDKNGSWIFEGTDRESYQCIYEMADTIIFLDTPLWKRRLRIFVRYVKQKFGFEKCHYKPDLNMLKMMYKWTREFEENRDKFEAKLKRFENKVIRLNKNKISLLRDCYS